MNSLDDNETFLTSLSKMIIQAPRLGSGSLLKPYSFEDMTDEIHMIILDNLCQNDKLKYCLLGKRYNRLAVSALLRCIGLLANDRDTMPYYLRGRMTILSRRKFNILQRSDTWMRHNHRLKLYILDKTVSSSATWTINERFLEPGCKYTPEKRLFTSFRSRSSPVNLDIRITDTIELPIPPEIQQLSINFEGHMSLEGQKNQLQCWSRNFANLKGLSMWNLEYTDTLFTSETLNLKDSQRLELETLDVRSHVNSVVEFLSLFNPTTLRNLFLENVFSGPFIFQCNSLSGLGIFLNYIGKNCLDRFSGNDIGSFLRYAEDSSRIQLCESLQLLTTNMRFLVEVPRHLCECSALRSIFVIPISVGPVVSISKRCKDAIQMLKTLNNGDHPRLKFFEFGVQFNIERVDGKYVESVIRGPIAAKEYNKVYNCHKFRRLLNRRKVQGLRKNFYEYYVV